jgi:DNA-binding transcriptional ArsR family regulator/uncharacterized protein YndB with AHSA1/START domain
MDSVFRALADQTRRYLLDLLHEDNGQTLSELCERLDMTRQSATQHLGVLEEANLISTVRRGREKLHYLNPVPIHEIQERWIEKFEGPRLQALSTLKRQAEGHMTDKPSFVYVTYIESTPEEVWRALTDPDLSARYWGHRNVSDWEAGSRWEHQRIDGPRRETTSQVSFDIEAHGEIVRLTVTHEDLTDRAERDEAAAGWAAVLSNLKSFLETGHPLPDVPWEVPQR